MRRFIIDDLVYCLKTSLCSGDLGRYFPQMFLPGFMHGNDYDCLTLQVLETMLDIVTFPFRLMTSFPISPVSLSAGHPDTSVSWHWCSRPDRQYEILCFRRKWGWYQKVMHSRAGQQSRVNIVRNHDNFNVTSSILTNVSDENAASIFRQEQFDLIITFTQNKEVVGFLKTFIHNFLTKPWTKDDYFNTHCLENLTYHALNYCAFTRFPQESE
jgi:hypothetical protein